MFELVYGGTGFSEIITRNNTCLAKRFYVDSLRDPAPSGSNGCTVRLRLKLDRTEFLSFPLKTGARPALTEQVSGTHVSIRVFILDLLRPQLVPVPTHG